MKKLNLMCLSGVKQYPMRVKCATLSWHTIVSAFDEKNRRGKYRKLNYVKKRTDN